MRLTLNFFNNIYDNKRYLIISIFLVSILCSLIFLIFFKNLGPSKHGVPGTDYSSYYEPMANNLLQGKGLTVEGRKGDFPLNIGPGYPIVLSGVFVLSQLTGIDELDLVVILNVILTAISCCFLFLIAKEFLNKRIALLTSLLWMSYPFNLWFLKNPNTEVPFIPLLFLGIWLYILTLKRKKLKFAFLGGLFLGLSSVARLISLFLPSFLALLIFFFLKASSKKRQLAFVMILLLGSLIAILPWGIYAFSKTGGFVSIPDQGPSAIVAGITWLIGPGYREILSDDVMGLVERVKIADPATLTELFQFFSQELIDRPLPVLKLIGLKLTRPWYATSSRWYEGEILAVQILYLFPAFLGLVYLIKNARDKIRDIFFLLSVVFYFWVMAFLNVSILRYMVPVMGLVFIFSAITVDIIINKVAKKFRLCRT